MRRGLSEEEFRKGEVGGRAVPFVLNGAYRSYEVVMTDIAGKTLLPIVFFEHGYLKRISFHKALDDGGDWRDLRSGAAQRWVNEIARWIELYLNRTLPAEFSWGRISAAVDPRSESGALTMEYRNHTESM